MSRFIPFVCFLCVNRVNRKDRLTGFSVYRATCISFPIVHECGPIVRVSYRVVRVSYRVVHVSYLIVYLVRNIVADTTNFLFISIAFFTDVCTEKK